jgi:hypothetical protein
MQDFERRFAEGYTLPDAAAFTMSGAKVGSK